MHFNTSTLCDVAETTRLARWRPPIDPAMRRQLLAVALLFAIYATLSVRQHYLVLTGGYDLGIYEQIARSYADFTFPRIPLVNDAVGFGAYHFSPILALLGFPYALAPSPVTLLLVQASLVAFGVLPLMNWAARTCGTGVSILVAFIYGLSPGVAMAIGFDFHEVAFAVPLMALSMCALGQQRWKSAVYWALPLVLVKEDLGLTVAAIGIYIYFHHQRRLGALTGLFGLLASALAIFVALPAFAASGNYYFQQTMVPHSLLGLIRVGFDGIDLKLITIVFLLGPTAFLALKSPLVLLTLPTLGWRFFSDNVNYWTPGFHYDLVLVPIVTAAFIDAISRHRERKVRPIIIAAALIFTVIPLSTTKFAHLVTTKFWADSPRAESIKRLAAMIPDNARVAASDHIVPQLTSRTTTFEFGTYATGKGGTPNDWMSANWIIVETKAPTQFKVGTAAAIRVRLSNGFKLVAEENGIKLLHRQTGKTG